MGDLHAAKESDNDMTPFSDNYHADGQSADSCPVPVSLSYFQGIMSYYRIAFFLLLCLLILPAQAQEREYTRLKGYYRVYQATNSMLTYFIDGMMEFYIPLNDSTSETAEAGKGSPFVDRKFLGERRRKAPRANGDDTFVRMSMPNLEQNTLMESIKGEEYSTRNNCDIYRWADLCGRIAYHKSPEQIPNRTAVTITMDNLVGQPGHEIDMSQMKMYGIIARMTSFEERETYRKASQGNYTLDSLTAAHKSQTFFAHYKGEDEDDRIDVWSDFYVTDRMTITESQLKRIRKEKNHVWTFTIPSSVPELDKDVAEAWAQMVEY